MDYIQVCKLEMLLKAVVCYNIQIIQIPHAIASTNSAVTKGEISSTDVTITGTGANLPAYRNCGRFLNTANGQTSSTTVCCKFNQ